VQPGGRGKPVGRWSLWYPAGHKEAEGSYVDGQRAGTWRYWAEDGARDPSLSGTYKDDKKVGP
jgi:antitoxin component YwqK of YwqJK toxin-antitoxin module